VPLKVQTKLTNRQ